MSEEKDKTLGNKLGDCGTKSGKVMTGKVKTFNEERGFGFITTEDKKDIFVHITKVENQVVLEKGQIVEFQTFAAVKGLQAVDVKVIEE